MYGRIPFSWGLLTLHVVIMDSSSLSSEKVDNLKMQCWISDDFEACITLLTRI